MIYMASADGVTQYQNAPGLNQSSLKKLAEDVVLFRENEPEYFYVEKENLQVGSGVDVQITQGIESYLGQYYVMTDTNKPSDAIMSIMHEVFNTAKQQSGEVHSDFTTYEEMFYYAFNAYGYYMNRFKPTYQEDKRIAEVIKGGGHSYWDSLLRSSGKTILSQEQSSIIQRIVKSIKEHPNTRNIFLLAENSQDYDLVFQFPVQFMYEDILCKGLLDIILINHKLKKIYVMDIKTTIDYLFKFRNTAKKYRYDFQASFYMEGMHYESNINFLGQYINRNLSCYTIDSFSFVVENTKEPGIPRVFRSTDQFLSVGKFGAPEVIIEGRVVIPEVKGFHQAIDDYKYYCIHGFDMSRDLREGKGILKLNWD